MTRSLWKVCGLWLPDVRLASKPRMDSPTHKEYAQKLGGNSKVVPWLRGSSKYRGVRWHERNGKWEARIFDSASAKQVRATRARGMPFPPW